MRKRPTGLGMQFSGTAVTNTWRGNLSMKKGPGTPWRGVLGGQGVEQERAESWEPRLMALLSCVKKRLAILGLYTEGQSH